MQIYVAEGTQHTGPFDLETIKAGLRAGRYQPGQLAWYDGAPGWEPISQLPGLEGFFLPPPPVAPAPAPVAPPPAPYTYPPIEPTPVPQRRSPWLVAVGIVVGLAALTDGIVTLSRGLRSGRADGSSPAPVAAPMSAAPPMANGSPSQTPTTPAAGTRRFVANRARYNGNVAAHFVAFSFDYPDDWTVVENVTDKFLEVHRYARLPNGSNVAVETVSISYAYSRPGTPLAANLPAVGSQLLELAAAPLLTRFPDATKTAPRSGRFGRYPAQEQFVTSPEDEDTQSPDMFFRQAIVARPNNAGTDGLFVTVFGSGPGGNPDAESLGKSGGLRVIEESFRFDP